MKSELSKHRHVADIAVSQISKNLSRLESASPEKLRDNSKSPGQNALKQSLKGSPMGQSAIQRNYETSRRKTTDILLSGGLSNLA